MLAIDSRFLAASMNNDNIQRNATNFAGACVYVATICVRNRA